MELRRINIIAGHYGVGKTTVSLNLALQAAAAGEQVTLADLDVVNPYFRSAEYRDLLEGEGVRVIAPKFSEAGSNLDAPGLNGAIVPALEAEEGALFIDAGGDDVGATALGRFAHQIEARDHALFYVVNAMRIGTADADEAVRILHEIEHACHLKATGIISNAHLMDETDLDIIEAGADFADKVAVTTGLPLAGITVPEAALRADQDADTPASASLLSRLEALEAVAPLIPITPHVRTPWQGTSA